MTPLLLALLAGCTSDEPSPYDECLTAKDAGDAACCSDDDCGADSLCWFSYICAPMGPDGHVECSGWSGDRACHATCPPPDTAAADTAGGGCAEGTCTYESRFVGSDAGEEIYICL